MSKLAGQVEQGDWVVINGVSGWARQVVVNAYCGVAFVDMVVKNMHFILAATADVETNPNLTQSKICK